MEFFPLIPEYFSELNVYEFFSYNLTNKRIDVIYFYTTYILMHFLLERKQTLLQSHTCA